MDSTLVWWQIKMRGTLHLLFARNGEKSPPPREASLAHVTPEGPRSLLHI